MYLGTALAELLYKAAMIPPHARILDIGHGCGDSLLVLAKQYEPACLHGVTSVPAHAHRARERLGHRATVWCADVVRWIRSDQATHSIYDVILALDCAYHFSDRAEFFRDAYARLAPGGTLALVDLVSAWPYPVATDATASKGTTASNLFHASTLPTPTRPPSVWHRIQHWCACYVSGSNPHAFVSFDKYKAMLLDAGFDYIEMQDISHDVFPGFSSFLLSIGVHDQAWRGGSAWQWRALRAFGKLVQTWAKGGNAAYVRCGLIVARKTQPHK